MPSKDRHIAKFYGASVQKTTIHKKSAVEQYKYSISESQFSNIVYNTLTSLVSEMQRTEF